MQLRDLNQDQPDEIERAYERVKTLTEANCPACWIKEQRVSELEINAYANEVNSYKCKKCGFSGVFPKSEH